jgi:neutral ceramidase
MMGWAMLHNVARQARTPLNARAFLLDDGQKRIAFVISEILSVSMSIRQRLVDRLNSEAPELGLTDETLCLMATHTHSGPGGYDHYPIYNLTIPGYVESTLDAMVDMIFRALVEAGKDLSPGRVRFASRPFPSTVPVAFNRQPSAHALNPEVDNSLRNDPVRALDRSMRLLRFEAPDGRVRGVLNWFAVHGTSVHSDNDALHFDNKGYAAQMLEHRMGEGAIAGFAQGAAGDVTPNNHKHRGRPWVRGESIDDDESARINGGYQCRHADALQVVAGEAAPLGAKIESFFGYVDFSDVAVDPRHASGEAGRRTGPGELGWAMLFGTEEGPGIPRKLLFSQKIGQRVQKVVRRVQRAPAARERADAQAPKLTVLQVGRRKVAGVSRLRELPLPFGVHPAVDQLIALDQSSLDDPLPWAPQILPIQVLRVGEVAIVAVSAEFTTAAGRRLRGSVAERLGIPVDMVVLAGYANAYCGYVTTPEEYELQNYEGASTHFGRWTLGAYQTSFDRLLDGTLEPGVEPPRFSDEDMAGRRFVEPPELVAKKCELPKGFRSGVHGLDPANSAVD